MPFSAFPTEDHIAAMALPTVSLRFDHALHAQHPPAGKQADMIATRPPPNVIPLAAQGETALRRAELGGCPFFSGQKVRVTVKSELHPGGGTPVISVTVGPSTVSPGVSLNSGPPLAPGAVVQMTTEDTMWLLSTASTKLLPYKVKVTQPAAGPALPFLAPAPRRPVPRPLAPSLPLHAAGMILCVHLCCR